MTNLISKLVNIEKSNLIIGRVDKSKIQIISASPEALISYNNLFALK